MNSKTTLPFKKRENPLANSLKPSAVSISSRDKYTATMDKDLRKKVKIAAVEKGIDFSQYVEEAVSEKLGREGY